MSLIEYNKKRNFKSTNEPKGEVKKRKTKKFVVQYHEARAKHYDFRLEHNGVLISWAIPKGLSLNPKDKRLAVHVEDHPIDYANFEGIIPKGNYGAGTVEIFDSGVYIPLEDLDKGLKKGHIKILLKGKKLEGAWSLFKFNEDNWFAVKIDDEYAKIKKPTNKKLPFKSADVQLATLTDKVPTGNDWIFEIKYDGYRMISFVENKKVKMFTRNGIDYTKKLNSVVESLQNLDFGSFVLDGEIVSFDKNGKSDFGLLQNALKNKKNNLFYCVFDLLALNGEDLRDFPLIERKEKLKRLLFKAEKNIIYSSHTNKGKETFSFAKENNLEGIIAKNKKSKYEGKRTDDWLKIKCYHRQEFVVIGYTTSEKNDVLSALLVGYYENGKLVYAGKVGTGFNEKDKQELANLFKKIISEKSFLNNEKKIKNVVWLKPKLVVEIQFAEFTKDGVLRQPSFIALREDKDAKDVVLEEKWKK